jgi:hypothetical protein
VSGGFKQLREYGALAHVRFQGDGSGSVVGSIYTVLCTNSSQALTLAHMPRRVSVASHEAHSRKAVQVCSCDGHLSLRRRRSVPA